MLELKQDHYIGEGAHRVCYRHPTDDSLCIKIPFEQSEEIKPLRREISYYQRLNKRKISWEMLSRFVNEVETNKGHGHVYTLVRDHDKQVSKNLVHYLADEQLIREHYQSLFNSLTKLFTYLLENQILPLTLYPRNIVIQLQDQPLAIIVDDIGNNEFVRFSEWSKPLARRKIIRKWQRFIKHLGKNSEHKPELALLLKQVESHCHLLMKKKL